MIKFLGIVIQAQANTNGAFIEVAHKFNEALWHAGLSLRNNTLDERVADVIQFPVEEAKRRHPSSVYIVE